MHQIENYLGIKLINLLSKTLSETDKWVLSKVPMNIKFELKFYRKTDDYFTKSIMGRRVLTLIINTLKDDNNIKFV